MYVDCARSIQWDLEPHNSSHNGSSSGIKRKSALHKRQVPILYACKIVYGIAMIAAAEATASATNAIEWKIKNIHTILHSIASRIYTDVLPFDAISLDIYLSLFRFWITETKIMGITALKCRKYEIVQFWTRTHGEKKDWHSQIWRRKTLVANGEKKRISKE